MKILRNEAIRWCSFIKMSLLSNEEQEQYIENALCELEEPVNGDGEKMKYAREYIEYEFSRYSNSYLLYFLQQRTSVAIGIEGNPPELFACNCCGYKTLEQKGEFFICKVCFWEDDWTIHDNQYSGPNHMELGEAKTNFATFGACDEASLRFLDKDRFLQFNK